MKVLKTYQFDTWVMNFHFDLWPATLDLIAFTTETDWFEFDFYEIQSKVQ